MRLILLFLATTLLIENQSFAQVDFPKGTYMSIEEIINKQPSQHYNLIIEKRTTGDIKMNGGNDFKLTSPDKSVSKKTVKKEVWAYSTGDSLYLNCFQYKAQPWYSNVISDGKYLVFKGGLSQQIDERKKQTKTSNYSGAIGGAFQGAKLATLRFLYAIDKAENKIITVTPENLELLLSNNSKLLTQYNNEIDKVNEQVLIKYLQLLNNN
ncbi:DUF6563 family protein [Formosa sp. L2A11]|uniref:DUF6563 family protein n=1 Tax=Formosa sp. L2A11 TaxID=2686363 RepID=UPI00131AE542|nr:DUF6563 family protein [Formosa sp. L2A11]